MPPQIERIIELLDTRPSRTKLTWEALRRRLSGPGLHVPSRQALVRHGEISDAYRQAKARLRTESSVDDPDSLLAVRVRKLQAQVVRLRVERLRLLERHMRWQYNACKYGVPPSRLDDPLPAAYRRRSD